MPLTIAPTGVDLVIKKILTNEKERRHLESLGLIAGASIRVQDNTGGSVILRIQDCRLAIDKELAARILV